MKFSTNEDIKAPVDAVFAMLCDFEGFERSAMRRGAEVMRTDKLVEPGVGMTWEAVFKMRGKRREMALEMISFDRPNEMAFESTSPGMLGNMRFELIALSRERTRMRAELEVKPLNLSARLLVQSLKLAKNSLSKKFKQRLGAYATRMEETYAKQV